MQLFNAGRVNISVETELNKAVRILKSLPYENESGSCNDGCSPWSLQVARLSVSLVFVLALFSAVNVKSSHAAEPEVFSVVELFTSHGCSSCPPADALFEEIIKKYPQVVALEYHVDYWDQLIHGNDGSWKDPFSDAEYTLRQQTYNNRSMQGRPGVYTPQMVVNGNYAAVGSQRRFVENALTRLASPAFKLDVLPDQDNDGALDTGSLNVSVVASKDELPLESNLWLVTFHRERTTEIKGGENNKLTLINHHIVTSINPLGSVGENLKTSPETDGRLLLAEAVTVELQQGQGCAVLMQDSLPGTIYAAGYCDRALWK